MCVCGYLWLNLQHSFFVSFQSLIEEIPFHLHWRQNFSDLCTKEEQQKQQQKQQHQNDILCLSI